MVMIAMVMLMAMVMVMVMLIVMAITMLFAPPSWSPTMLVFDLDVTEQASNRN